MSDQFAKKILKSCSCPPNFFVWVIFSRKAFYVFEIPQFFCIFKNQKVIFHSWRNWYTVNYSFDSFPSWQFSPLYCKCLIRKKIGKQFCLVSNENIFSIIAFVLFMLLLSLYQSQCVLYQLLISYITDFSRLFTNRLVR